MSTAAPSHMISSPAHCAWCGMAFDDDSERLHGRRRCRSCGAATTDPWPDQAELDRAYADWYRPPSGRFAGPGDWLLHRTRGLLARRLDRIAPPGAVLDVGAGDGALLDALQRRGREALGLERTSARPDVRTLELDELDGRFAAVVFWHSLEHLRAPGAALARAYKLLLPAGVIVIAIPNSASLQARAFGDAWLALDLPRHLVHLPASALLGRLEAVGLRVERLSHVRAGQVLFGWLHGLVHLLPGRPELYDAIRRPSARRTGLRGGARAATLAAAATLLPAAAALAALEVAMRRGGSIYVEARKQPCLSPASA
ncbi:MAG: class I SAM-dependent methyltransferase [Thermoleophilaceae bacterium]|nr:class I SAM-dependent methyltransferase [Thermoleophilaceae bacterium]